MTQNSSRDTAKLVGSQAFFVMLGYGFTFAVGFPLQIFLARSLGATNLGLFSLIDAVVGIATGLMGFGLAAAAVKFIPNHLARHQYATVKRLIAVCSVILALNGALAAIVIFSTGHLIANFFVGRAADPALVDAVKVAALMVPLGLLLYLYQQVLRGFFDLRYAIVGSSIIQLSVKAALAAILIFAGYQLLGLVVAVIVSQLASLVWMVVGVWKKQRALKEEGAPPPENVEKIWRNYAINQYSRFVITIGVGYLDRFLLGFLAGPSAVGVLSVVQQLQTIPGVALEMLLTIVAPVLSASHARENSEEAHRVFHMTTDWVVRISMPIVIFFVVFAEPTMHLYGPMFVEAGILSLTVVMLGQLLNILMGPTTTYLNMCGFERAYLNIHIAAQVVYVLCLLALLPWLGVLGAILARLASSIFANAAALIVAKKHTGLRWWDERFKMWVIPAVLTTGTALVLRVTQGSDIAPFTLLAIFMGTFLIFHLVFTAQGLSEDDKSVAEMLLERFGRGKGNDV